MLKQEAKFLEVIQRDGVASLATCGPDGVHLVATWNRFLMVQDEMLLIPAGGYRKTQSNAEKGSLVQLLVGSPEVEGKNREAWLRLSFNWTSGVSRDRRLFPSDQGAVPLG